MKLATFTILACSMLTLAGCGVRGKPQPPLQPPELGRGQPTFTRSSSEFAFPEVPSPDSVPRPTPTPPREY